MFREAKSVYTFLTKTSITLELKTFNELLRPNIDRYTTISSNFSVNIKTTIFYQV